MGVLLSRESHSKIEFNVRLSQLESSGSMLKRRPSKRFVLAETGEESAWNTTTDNDPDMMVSPAPPPVPLPPQIEIGLITSASSNDIEEVVETAPLTPTAQLLTVPTPIKSGMK